MQDVPPVFGSPSHLVTIERSPSAMWSPLCSCLFQQVAVCPVRVSVQCPVKQLLKSTHSSCLFHTQQLSVPRTEAACLHSSCSAPMTAAVCSTHSSCLFHAQKPSVPRTAAVCSRQQLSVCLHGMQDVSPSLSVHPLP